MPASYLSEGSVTAYFDRVILASTLRYVYYTDFTASGAIPLP